MSNIVTITFSPCIDKSTSVPELLPETKLKCTSPKLEPGGGGINVARAIHKLGGEAVAIFPSGGCMGDTFNALMQQENITSIIVETEQEMRENLTVFDDATNKQYRFGMPHNTLATHEWKKLLIELEMMTDVEYIVASGSLPNKVPLTIFAQLAKIAKHKNAKLIVDTAGEALKQALDEGVYLIKPNLEELRFLAGKKALDSEGILQAAKSLVAEGKSQVVVVSMGASNTLLVAEDKVEYIKPPLVACKSTVGAGDSMVAGIVLSLAQGKNIFKAVQYGVACGSAATMNEGTELCRKEDADKLLLQIQ